MLRFGGKFHDERQRHYETPQYHYADDVDPWPSCAPESKNGELQSHLRHTSSGFAVDNTQDIVSEYESSSVIHRATIIVSSGLVGSLAGAILAEVMNVIRMHVCVYSGIKIQRAFCTQCVHLVLAKQRKGMVCDD